MPPCFTRWHFTPNLKTYPPVRILNSYTTVDSSPVLLKRFLLNQSRIISFAWPSLISEPLTVLTRVPTPSAETFISASTLPEIFSPASNLPEVTIVLLPLTLLGPTPVPIPGPVPPPEPPPDPPPLPGPLPTPFPFPLPPAISYLSAVPPPVPVPVSVLPATAFGLGGAGVSIICLGTVFVTDVLGTTLVASGFGFGGFVAAGASSSLSLVSKSFDSSLTPGTTAGFAIPFGSGAFTVLPPPPPPPLLTMGGSSSCTSTYISCVGNSIVGNGHFKKIKVKSIARATPPVISPARLFFSFSKLCIIAV